MTTELNNEPSGDDSRLRDLLLLANEPPVEPSVEVTERVWSNLTAQKAMVRPSRRVPRAFAERTTRYSLISIVLGILVVAGLNQRHTRHLLADVTDAIARHKTVRFTTEGAAGRTAKGYWTLDSMHFRTVQEGLRRVFDYSTGTILVLNPKDRTGRLIRFDPRHSGEPRLEQLEVMRSEGDAEPEWEDLNGRDVLVYELLKSESSLHTKTVVWADPTTSLPLQIEQVRTVIKPGSKPQVEVLVMREFVWDPPEIEQIDVFFSVTPPRNYDIEFVNADSAANGARRRPEQPPGSPNNTR